MKKRNIVLISMDEVRPDNLSCYGYGKIRTEHIDRVAEEGVLFQTCLAASCFTPLCMSSVLCGVYPNKHLLRNPFGRIRHKTIAETLKEYGYRTAGFVGVGVLGARHGFSSGFDSFDEPSEDTIWRQWDFEDPSSELFYEGNWWVDRMVNWLRENHSVPFFVWGHYYETHEGAEKPLLRDKLIKEGELSQFGYKDAKIKYMDEQLFGQLLQVFGELRLWESTTLVILSDHGTNLGEHPAKPIPHHPDGLIYPQHMTLHDVNVKVPLIIKDKDLPPGRKVPAVVRSIDIVPTILDLSGIGTEKMDLDGFSLLPLIAGKESKGRTAYAECLYDFGSRELGESQALRTHKFKFIRDLVKGSEEYYDSQDDPDEQNNLIQDFRESQEEELEDLRRKLNGLLFGTKSTTAPFSSKEKEEIKNRLRSLGYME